MRIPTGDVTEAVCSYFAVNAALTHVPSKTGQQLTDIENGTTGKKSANVRNTQDLRLANCADLAKVVSGLSRKEVEALRLKYWTRKGYILQTRREPGKAGKTVLVPYVKACLPSDSFCARAMGMPSEHAFRNVLKRARKKVSRTLFEIRERQKEERDRQKQLLASFVQIYL